MLKQTNKITSYCIAVVLSLLTTISLAQISHYGITGIELLLPCVFALCLILYIKMYRQLTGTDVEKKWALTIPLGVIASVLTDVGSHIDMDIRAFSPMGIADVLYIVFLAPFFISVFHLLFFQSEVCVNDADADFNRASAVKNFFKCMSIMLLCWFPYYLTYFPGGIGNDVFESVNMCLGTIAWSNHHPVFFTALIKLFISLGNILCGENASTADVLVVAFGIMSFAQMIILSATLSSVIVWLERRKAKRLFRVVSLAGFALHPIVAMYSIYITKDVLFACSIVIMVLFIADMIEAEKVLPKHFASLGIIAFASMITRNNGTFIVIALAVVLLIICKKYRKQTLVTFVIVLACNALYKGPVWNAIGIEKQSFVESASIPLTQIAYTICNDGKIDAEEEEYLQKLMPFDKVKEEYEPGYTDSYKFSQYFDKEIVDEEPGKLLKVWFKMLPSNFGKYVEAYLIQTSGYWCYGISNTVATEGVQPNELGLNGYDCIEHMVGISFKGIMEELVLVARKLPLLCMLSQMAIQMWAVVLVGLKLLSNRKKQMAVTMLPLVVLWMTIMIATPAHCLFRYMCPVFFLWPFLIYLFFSKE